MISLLGRNETSDDQLDNIGKEIFKSKWGGVMSAENIRLDKRTSNKYFILNTGGLKSGGIHWIGLVVKEGKTIYVYDSFGRRSSMILRSLVKQANENGYKIIESYNDREQRNSSALCGQISRMAKGS